MVVKIATIYRENLGTAREYLNWLHEELDTKIFRFSETPGKDIEKFDGYLFVSSQYIGQLQLYYFIKNRTDLLKNKKIAIALIGNIPLRISKQFRYFFRLTEEIQSNITFFRLPGRLLDFSFHEIDRKNIMPIIHYFKE